MYILKIVPFNDSDLGDRLKFGTEINSYKQKTSKMKLNALQEIVVVVPS